MTLTASKGPQETPKKVKNKSLDDPELEDVVMEDGFPKISWQNKLVGNMEDRGLGNEVVVESKLEIGEDDYTTSIEGEYLEITFSEQTHEWIDRNMAKTVVVLRQL
ncbi:hypothetical protein GOBAR_DD18154 [Gossypium barbadense]|nr:hypothetical protein GOBAR_DD18154 [Gossypium barbadense]